MKLMNAWDAAFARGSVFRPVAAIFSLAIIAYLILSGSSSPQSAFSPFWLLPLRTESSEYPKGINDHSRLATHVLTAGTAG
jgi:hypothetical protein